MPRCKVCSTNFDGKDCPVCQTVTGLDLSGAGDEEGILVRSSIQAGVDTPAILEEISSRRQFPVAFPMCRLGRDPSNDIIINGDDSVSRFHADIVHEDGVFYVNDRGSTNGTFLNGAPVFKQTAMKNGDKLRVGRLRFKFQVDMPVGEDSYATFLRNKELSGWGGSEAQPSGLKGTLDMTIPRDVRSALEEQILKAAGETASTVQIPRNIANLIKDLDQPESDWAPANNAGSTKAGGPGSANASGAKPAADAEPLARTSAQEAIPLPSARPGEDLFRGLQRKDDDDEVIELGDVKNDEEPAGPVVAEPDKRPASAEAATAAKPVVPEKAEPAVAAAAEPESAPAAAEKAPVASGSPDSPLVESINAPEGRMTTMPETLPEKSQPQTGAADTPEPAWLSRYLWDEVGRLNDEIEELHEIILSAERKMQEAEGRIKSLRQLRTSLLASTGQPFLEACCRVLSDLGWQCRKEDSDQIAVSEDGKVVAIGRVVAGPPETIYEEMGKLAMAQVAHWCKHKSEPAGVLILNPFTSAEGQSVRESGFADDIEEFARRKNVCVVTSLQLLCVFKELESGSSTAETLRRSILSTTGRLPGFKLEPRAES